MKLNFYIGYDSKEDIAYRVCKYSLLKRTNAEVNVLSLKLDELIAKNLYTRNTNLIDTLKISYETFYLNSFTIFSILTDLEALKRITDSSFK